MTASTSSKFTSKTARTAKTRVAQDIGAAYQGSKPEPIVEAKPRVEETEASESFLASIFPSSRRVLGATVLAFCTYAGATYFTMPFVELVSLYATVTSGSAFLGLMVWCIGLVLAIWSAAVLGYRAFKFVLDFDADRLSDIGASIKESSQRKVSLVRGWFTNEPAAA